MRFLPVLLAVLGMIAGAWVAGVYEPRWASTAPVRRGPLPHQVAKYPGGISLRFAMVHDVVHERFPKHGAAYYKARNAAARAALDPLIKAAGPDGELPDAAWRLMDDIAVGHVHLGEFDPAAALMRDKLARQQKLGVAGADLYPTYANLGTAMMIDAIVKMNAGHGAAAGTMRESLDWVRKSIEVNPQAHFGREVWQVVLGEYLLASLKDPALLDEFDMIGNTLDGPSYAGGRPATGEFRRAARVATDADAGMSDGTRAAIRRSIAHGGVAADFARRVSSSVKEPAPFDEPTLAIVGMWRYGAGANVHFALALAETMNRVGQQHIAWCAYERCARLAGPGKRAEYCRKIQSRIEGAMSASERAQLRPAFEADLKAGLDYQAAYQAYEAEQLAAGKSVDDPTFYDAFHAKHGSIASAPQLADFVTYQSENPAQDVLPLALLGGGICSALGYLLISRPRHRRAAALAARAA